MADGAKKLKATAEVVTLPVELQDERVLNVKQVAAMYGVSVPHLRRMYRTRKVPKPFRIGERTYGWTAGTIKRDIAARTTIKEAA